jgi:hypothetical protein
MGLFVGIFVYELFDLDFHQEGALYSLVFKSLFTGILDNEILCYPHVIGVVDLICSYLLQDACLQAYPINRSISRRSEMSELSDSIARIKHDFNE